MAADASGALVLAGLTTDGITLALPHTGTLAFVTKLSADGTTFQWDHPFTCTSTMGPALASTASGKISVALTFTGTLSYGTGTLSSPVGHYAVALLTLDASGAVVWAASFGGTDGDASVISVDTDPTGAAVFTGTYTSTSFNSSLGAGTSGLPLKGAVAGKPTGYVVKVEPAMGVTTVATALGTQTDAIAPIKVRSVSGKLVVAGQYAGHPDLGAGPLPLANGTDGLAIVLDGATLKPGLVTTFGGSAAEAAYGATLDPWGNLVVAGQYWSADAVVGSTATTKTLKPTTFGVAGLVTAKWDPAGKLLWANGVVSTLQNGTPPYGAPDGSTNFVPNGIQPTALAVSASGVVTVGGQMFLGADFGDGMYQARLSTLNAPPLSAPLCALLKPFCGTWPSPDGLVVTLTP